MGGYGLQWQIANLISRCSCIWASGPIIGTLQEIIVLEIAREHKDVKFFYSAFRQTFHTQFPVVVIAKHKASLWRYFEVLKYGGFFLIICMLTD